MSRTGPWLEFAPVVPMTRAFRRDGCTVFVGREPTGPHGAERWHLSISRQDRYPNWDEIKSARYDLVPDEAVMVMVLPPKRQYVNTHPNCFHLHECPEMGELR